jgi:hypothetical protein
MVAVGSLQQGPGNWLASRESTNGGLLRVLAQEEQSLRGHCELRTGDCSAHGEPEVGPPPPYGMPQQR